MLHRRWALYIDLDGWSLSASSSPLQERVKCVEAFKSAAQDFFVRKPLFGAAFQNAIDSDAFRPLEFVIFQIGIVNHLADFLDRFVSNHESLRQRFKSAVLAHVRKLGIEHVE